MLGEEHPDTLASINNLVNLLNAQGEFTEAEPYVCDALEKERRVRGDEQPFTLDFAKAMGSLLQAECKHQEAIDLLDPVGPATRKAFTGDKAWRLADSLTVLSRAQVGVGFDAERFQTAESNLLEAHHIYLAVKDRGPPHKDTLACVQGLVDLYTAWYGAEPGKKYDAKAAEWRAKLDAAKAEQSKTPMPRPQQ